MRRGCSAVWTTIAWRMNSSLRSLRLPWLVDGIGASARTCVFDGRAWQVVDRAVSVQALMRMRYSPANQLACLHRLELSRYAAYFLGRPGPRRTGNSSTGRDRYPSGSAIQVCNALCDHAQARPPRCTGAGKRPAAMRRYRVGRLSAVMRRTSRMRKNAGVARTCTLSAVSSEDDEFAGGASGSSMRSANCCGARL